MPLIDMPLSELRKYRGRSPRPKDFDAFWARALKEMRGTNPMLEMKPAEFQAPCAECFDLYFTGVRGARIHAKYLRPRRAGRPHPAVVQFHGYSGDCGDWSGKLQYVAMGYSIAALDCRGQGGQSEDSGGVKGNTLRGHIVRGLDDSADNLLFRHVYLDTAQLTGLVIGMKEVDPGRVGVFGGSQGGGLTLACAALEPRVKLAAPTFPFLSDFKRVWEMDLAKDAYQELRDFFRMFDPEHRREEEIFNRLGYIDIQNLAPRIKARVMMGVGLMDTICPPSSQFAAYNKIKAPKELVIYPDFGHEGLPGFSDKVFQFMGKL